MYTKSRFPHDFSRYQCELGEKFSYTSPRTKKTTTVKFIKITRKGFNFLNLETNKCVFTKPVYDKDFSNKPIDSNFDYFRVQIPNWFRDRIKRQPRKPSNHNKSLIR